MHKIDVYYTVEFKDTYNLDEDEYESYKLDEAKGYKDAKSEILYNLSDYSNSVKIKKFITKENKKKKIDK